jgi:hypothetical protein
MTKLDPQSVALYLKFAGSSLPTDTPTPHASDAPELMMVTNAVAVAPPTWTDRLLGNTAATRLVPGGEPPGAHAPAAKLMARSSKRANKVG